MPSAGSFRRHDQWNAGDTTPRVLDIGSPSQTDRERATKLGLLRIGYLGADLGDPIEAVLKIGDNGSVLGPIDVPLVLVVEEPVHVTLTPVGAPTALTRVVLSVTPVCCPIDIEYATRTLTVGIGTVVPLPQWVRSVSSLAPATFAFRTRAGAPISGALSGTYSRPDMAADIVGVAAGTVVLSY